MVSWKWRLDGEEYFRLLTIKYSMAKLTERKKLFRRIKVPLYGGYLYLFVSPDIKKVVRRHAHKFLETDLSPVYTNTDARGCIAESAGNVGLFFDYDSLDREVLGHELLHATNAIMLHSGHSHDSVKDEPHAYLCGVLHKLVARALKRAQVRIKD
jgi:hypothetical protein